ncbi:ABC-2 type transport system ATP-binding protein [Pedobacter sp. UYP30]|uniref:ABC transporter ATP-binding protein n=1 Tax=Pedobacter sp. UYP30 TaxID=1756400 RepID=UPI0033912414
MLQISHFEKSYFNHLVLKIDNIELPEGVFWIKGKNGSGKSTLLKSIAGIQSFKGDISIDDIFLKKSDVAYRRLVNFADAEPLFPEFLTGVEMLTLFVKAKGATRAQASELVSEMKMESYIHNPLNSYSSGMLKKLSILLAFIGQPKLILLDEPLNTLDLDSLQLLYKWITEKFEKENISFLLSSHQPLDSGELPNLKQIEVIDKQITLNF